MVARTVVVARTVRGGGTHGAWWWHARWWVDEVLGRAFDTVGWPPGSVAVFVWASPPCETYSTLTLGTLAGKCGAQRKGRGDAYAPVGGRRGAKARDADRLAIRIMAYLHRHSTR